MRGTARMKGVVALQRLAFPLVFAQIAATANGSVTGWFLAQNSSSALQASLPGSMLAAAVSMFAVSTLGYAGTIFARRHAADDAAGAVATFRAARTLAIAALPLFAAAWPAGRFVLSLFSLSGDVFSDACAYYAILLANGYFATLAAILGGYFTGQGRTAFVGTVSAAGCIVNAALAPLFISGTLPAPFRGITGAGLAAVAAGLLTCGVLAAGICLRPVAARPQAPTRRDCMEILRLGLPAGVRSLVDTGGFFLFTALIAECPAAPAVASTAAFTVNGIFQIMPWSLSRATEIAAARAPEPGLNALLRDLLVLCGIYSALFAAVLALFWKRIMCGFIAADATYSVGEFLPAAGALAALLAAKAFFESATSNLQAFLRGRGETAAVMRIQLATSLLFWIPLFLAVKAFAPGVVAYWLTMLACAALSAALLARRARACASAPSLLSPVTYCNM